MEFLIFVLASTLAHASYSGFSSVLPVDVATGGLVGLIFILIARQGGLFRLDSLISFQRHAQTLLLVSSASVFAVIVVFFFLKTGSEHSRVALLLFYVFAIFGVMLDRLVVSRWLNHAIGAGTLSGRPVLVIGEREEIAGLGPREFLNYGIDEVARFELQGRNPNLQEADRALVAQAVEYSRQSAPIEFALMINWRRPAALADLLELLRESPLPVRLYPDLQTRDIFMRHCGAHFDPYLSIEMQRAPLRWGERVAKRGFDVAFATSMLLMLAPVLVITALLIKLESRGPIIFRQRRMGFDRRVFTIFKFRTMTVLEDGEVIRQARRMDKRVTAIGRILRKTSIDELPQLFNVLVGDMSLVGPRPHALAHDIEYSAKIIEYARRHHVKPGLTGAAQVRGYRGETRTLKQMSDRIEWDLWYINNWSFFLDIKILVQTFFALLAHESF